MKTFIFNIFNSDSDITLNNQINNARVMWSYPGEESVDFLLGNASPKTHPGAEAEGLGGEGVEFPKGPVSSPPLGDELLGLLKGPLVVAHHTVPRTNVELNQTHGTVKRNKMN